MGSGMWKTTIREIKGSFGRYVAILAIVMLGVGLFSGLKATTPAMIVTENAYLAEQNFFDFRLLSTVGFAEEDVEELAGLEEVADVEGAVSVDAVCSFGDGNESVYKFHTVPERINRVVVVAGRLPERADECVLDSAAYGEEAIGSKVTVTDNNGEDTLEMFGNRTFTAVGIVQSPYYINFERGTTSVGEGKIKAFLYVPKEAFACDYLTEVYVALKQKYDVYTEEYESYIDAFQEEMEEKTEGVVWNRYGEIITEAQGKIEDAQTKLDEKTAEAEEELADAWRKILDGEQEIGDGEQELLDGEQKIADGRKEIADHEQEIRDGEQEILDGEREIQEKEQEILDADEEVRFHEWEVFDNELKLAMAKDELEEAKEMLKEKETMLLGQEALLLEKEEELLGQEAALQGQLAVLQEQEAALVWQEAELAGQEEELARQEAELAGREEELAGQEEELARQEAELARQEEALAGQEAELARQEEALAGQEAELAGQEEALAGQEAELSRQEAELESRKEQLGQAYAKQQISQGEYEEGMGQIQIGLEQLQAGREQLQAGREGLQAGKGQLEVWKGQLQAGREQLQAGKGQLQAGKEQLQAGKVQLQAGKGQIAAGKEQLQAGKEQIEAGKAQLQAGIGQLQAGKGQIQEGLGQLQAGLVQIQDGKGEIQDGKEQIKEAWDKIAYNEDVLQSAETELMAGKAEVSKAREELEDGKVKLGEAKTELEDGKAKLAEGRAKLAKARADLVDAQTELEDGRAELEDGRAELADAKAEYADAKEEFDGEVADARQKIADAREELADVEEPDDYVLNRNTNIGYACYESDSNIVAAIANVFPVFFFLVAALVCMTTMNRMIEEQRTQIGVMKALGYGNVAIMGKYLFYAGSAAVIGAVIGCLGGTWLFPKVIWMGYSIMYSMGDIEYFFDVRMALLSLAAALLCSVGAAYFSCRYELYSVPANLIRPKAPKGGKRIFLEKVTFIWGRMKFLHKVSVRNIVRYKKRFFMMIIGISGCTALLVTGFGIKDSVTNVADMQYDEIQIYDIGITFADRVQETEIEGLAGLAGQDGELLGHIACWYEESVELDFGGRTKSVYLEIPEKEEETGICLNLHTQAGEGIPYPAKNEAVLTAKVAENMGIKAGDEVVLRDNDQNSLTVTVAALCENFVSNYIYINKETYGEQLGAEPEYKSAYVLVKEGADVHEAAAAISDSDNVLAVSVTKDMRERISTMMESMDYIVALIIACAGSLAFIVLYNLTNINITERIREIATIKVLGFYARETADYVFRENLVLTGMGAVVGLGLGKWLHWFVMYNVNIDTLSFKTVIRPVSYVWSVLFTFGFALLVNGIMYFKLEKINMAESLKSIE